MQRTLPNIMLASAGFACFLALNSFSLWGFSLLPVTALGESASTLWNAPLSLANALTFLVFVAGACLAPRLFGRNPWPLALAFMAAAIALVALYPPTGSGAVLAVGGACMGAGTTCCFFCWARAFFADGLEAARASIVLGSVLSAVPYLAFLTLDPSAITATLGLLALLNLAALAAHGRLARAAGSPPVPTCAAPVRELARRYWKPLLCLAMIGFAAPVIATLTNEATRGLSFTQQSLMVHSENIIAALILGVGWLGFKRNVSIVSAFTVAFPIITTALLLYFFVDPAARVFVPYVSGIVFVVFSMLVMMESVAESEREGMGLTLVYGLFAGLFYCANRLGDFMVRQAGDRLLHETSVMVAMFALLYGCSIVMFFITRKPRAGDGEDEQQPAAPVADPIDETCRRISEQQGLSERQTEVLVLLAHGYDVPTIAQKLFVSENTVRTHAKKVYAALGVHSKKEIIELANDPQADGRIA